MAENGNNVTEGRRVVVHTDVGTDDAVALLMLLNAEKLRQVKIEMIVCSYGNTSLENVVGNVVRVLKKAKRTDIPVYKGVSEPLMPTKPIDEFYHGMDGFGDLKYCEGPDLSLIREESYLQSEYALVNSNPGKISLICLAPLTDVALLFKLYPDFRSKIKELYVMGGNHKGWGNVTLSAEFNFYTDPEAAHIVMVQTQCPTFLLTWECCLNAHIPMSWRFSHLSSFKGPAWQLIDKAEESVYRNWKEGEPWTPCDAFLAAVFLRPREMIQVKTLHHVQVECAGLLTRGQAVFDHKNEKPKLIWIIKKIKEELFKDMVTEAAASV